MTLELPGLEHEETLEIATELVGKEEDWTIWSFCDFRSRFWGSFEQQSRHLPKRMKIDPKLEESVANATLLVVDEDQDWTTWSVCNVHANSLVLFQNHLPNMMILDLAAEWAEQ